MKGHVLAVCRRTLHASTMTTTLTNRMTGLCFAALSGGCAFAALGVALYPDARQALVAGTLFGLFGAAAGGSRLALIMREHDRAEAAWRQADQTWAAEAQGSDDVAAAAPLIGAIEIRRDPRPATAEGPRLDGQWAVTGS